MAKIIYVWIYDSRFCETVKLRLPRKKEGKKGVIGAVPPCTRYDLMPNQVQFVCLEEKKCVFCQDMFHSVEHMEQNLLLPP